MIELARVPVAVGVAGVAAAHGRSAVELACTAGEDYELLATLPPGAALPADAVEIGRCEPGAGAVFVDDAGGEVALRGWEHFR